MQLWVPGEEVLPLRQGEGRRPDDWRRREVLTARRTGLEFILKVTSR